jgi:hypothetical protein
MVIGVVAGAVLDTTMGPLITAMDKLTETVRESFQFADRAQKASLALGVSYEQTSESLGSTMKGLRGDISQKFQAGIASMEVGLQGNTAGIAKLINQQMLTGTQYQQTAKAFATLETGLDLSRQDTNNLATSFKLIGNKWEISTDKLVTAMDGLKDTLPSQRLAGMGSGMTQAMMETLGSLGPQLMPEFNKVMMAIFDPTVEGAGVLMRLGIGNIRERLGQERDTLVRSKMLMDAIEIAGGRYNKMAEGADKAFFMIDKANQAYGKSGIHFSTLAAALGDRLERSGHDIADYWNTAKNLFKEMFAGFQEGITTAYPFFLEALKAVSSVAKVLGEQFNIFAKSLTGEHGAAKAMFEFKMAILRGAALAYEKIEFIFDLLERFITKGVPYIFDRLQAVFYQLTRPGGMITKFSYALTMLSAAMLNAAEYFTKGKADTRLKEARARAEIRGEELWKEIDDTYWLKKPVMGYPSLLKGYIDSDVKKVVSEPGLLNTYENYMKEQGPNALSPFAQGLKDIIKDKENDPKSLTLKALHDLIAVGEKNGYQNHEDHEENRREKNSLEFLESSANVFGGTVRDILGLDEGSTIADLYKLLLEANEQRDAISILNRLDAYGN